MYWKIGMTSCIFQQLNQIGSRFNALQERPVQVSPLLSKWASCLTYRCVIFFSVMNGAYSASTSWVGKCAYQLDLECRKKLTSSCINYLIISRFWILILCSLIIILIIIYIMLIIGWFYPFGYYSEMFENYGKFC